MTSTRMSKICLNIEPTLLEKAKEAAKRLHCSCGQLIRTSVWKYVTEMEDEVPNEGWDGVKDTNDRATE